MSWALITEADVLTHISGAELESLRVAALGSGQIDPVQPTIDQVTATIRGFVAACKMNKLDVDVTKVPTRLLGWALDIIIAEIINRVPGYDLDEGRKDNHDKAMSILKDVAACKFAIDDPLTGDDPGHNVEQVSSTTRKATRDSLDGL